MEVLRTTSIKAGAYTIKIVAIVAGIGITMVIMRPVRQALFARFHARSRNIYRKEMDDKRREMFRKVENLDNNSSHRPLNIVEIGTGIVENAQFYPTNSDITCITTNVYRKKELLRLEEEYPYVKIVHEPPDAMTSLQDNSIDVVVSVLGLCTTRDVDKALGEIKRVLKKGGKYYFVEHVAAKKLSVTSQMQKRYRIWWGMFFYGCIVDRKLSKNLKTAGFQNVELEKFTADVDIGGERYLKKGLNGFINKCLVYMIGPHIMGTAIK